MIVKITIIYHWMRHWTKPPQQSAIPVSWNRPFLTAAAALTPPAPQTNLSTTRCLINRRKVCSSVRELKIEVKKKLFHHEFVFLLRSRLQLERRSYCCEHSRLSLEYRRRSSAKTWCKFNLEFLGWTFDLVYFAWRHQTASVLLNI